MFDLDQRLDRLFGWVDGERAQKGIRVFVWIAVVGFFLLGLVNAENTYDVFMGYPSK
jgi:hypothetical protein